MTEEQFDSYGRVPNSINPDASFDGCMFETYGPELDVVMAQDLFRVWTIIEEDGNIEFVPGFHYVNRLGYLITTKPWDSKTGVVRLQK